MCSAISAHIEAPFNGVGRAWRVTLRYLAAFLTVISVGKYSHNTSPCLLLTLLI